MIVEVGDKKKILYEKIIRLMVLMNIIPYRIEALAIENTEEEYVDILKKIVDALIKSQDDVRKAYYSYLSKNR